MTISQISVFLENKAGQLADITGILSEKQVNMRAISIAETADYGILRLIVDDAPKAIACIQQNLAFTKMEDRAVVWKQDVCSALGSIREEAVDIIFLDPPYEDGQERAVLALLKEMRYVTEDTIIVAEAAKETDFSWVTELGYQVTKDKRYKTNKHLFIKREQP